MNSTMIFLTPAAGKKLIGMAVAGRQDMKEALREKKVLCIGGTTNVYVANALLEAVGSPLRAEFSSFKRGVSVPPGTPVPQADFQGDLLIEKGVPRFVNDLPGICSSLGEGDIILKGANAVHLKSRTAGILIGNGETGGTIMEACRPVLARRTKLILPVGLEKRVEDPITELQFRANAPGARGLRIFAAPGEPFTELDAIRELTGCSAVLAASGGVCGGEGGVYLSVAGDGLSELLALLPEVQKESPVTL